MLQCGQGTPTAPTDSQTPVQPEGNTTHQDTPTNNLPSHPHFTHPSVTPQTSPIEQESPIRMQTNLLSQHSIAAPEATMPDTPEEKISISLNGEGVKNSRKQVATSTTNAQGSRLCFRCKQLGHLKTDFPELPYCSKCKLKATSQQSVLPNTGMADGRTKDAKMLMKDAKLVEKIGRKCRTDPSSLTEPTNVLTVQATMEHMIAQQGNNHKHPPIGHLSNGTGIYKNNSQFQNHLPQQHSQQSTSMVGISTPTLIVNNQLQTDPQQGQQQNPSPQITPVSQHANSLIRHNQFNQHF